MWYGCHKHCEGADKRDMEESHGASRVYGIEEEGDKCKIRPGYVQHKARETNDKTETKEEPEKEKEN